MGECLSLRSSLYSKFVTVNFFRGLGLQEQMSPKYRAIKVLPMTYKVAVVREVSASPEKVWSLVTDLPRMGEWSPENLGGEWLDGATCAAVGARFRGDNKNGDKSWQATVSVGVCDAPKKFVFTLKFKENHLCDWVYEIEPTATGCRVTHAWVAGTHWEQFAPFGKDISGVDDRATHNLRNMGVTLDNLVKALDTV